MSAVLAKPQVKDFLKTLAKGKEKGQEQRKEHEGGRRNNLVYIAPSTLIHTCGNSVQFLDLVTKSQTNLPSVGGDGIGCIAVHPSKAFFAVCEKGNHPNVYVYNYPTLTTYKVLKLGTEKHFTAAAFNFDGSQLATVGGHPDYWLTVWDWTNESIVLQSKAFSQDVFQVSFSRHFLGQLVTSGIGHIRFWKMANTFTGPKLEPYATWTTLCNQAVVCVI
ncbi:hypothetical protein L7F22_043180 [Adiantum nelumboides]|nr:hypothetical protein [Adiantum nelumboides]